MACSSSTVGLAPDDGCTLNSQCATGLVCAFGRCSAACRTAADCMGGECVFDATMHAVCQYSEAQLCEKQSDCPAPLACASDYRCRNLCADDADCNVLGINGRICARDANGVDYCAVPSEVSGGEIVALPPLNFIPEEGGPGVPDGAVVMGLDAGGTSDASDATIGAIPTEAGPDAGPTADTGPLGFIPTNFSLTMFIDAGT